MTRVGLLPLVFAAGCGAGAFDESYAEKFGEVVERCGGDATGTPRLERDDGCAFDGQAAADCLDGLDAVSRDDCSDLIDAPGEFPLPEPCERVFTCD